jgi:hypothetical protein
MTIRATEEADYEIVVDDDDASVCSGAPSTMTGTGRLEGTSTLVVPSPVLTCDNGSEPKALSGPPLEEQLRNLTFVHHPEDDVLTDNLGSVWELVRAESHTIRDGEVTFSAAPPWELGFAGPWGLWLADDFDERFHVVADPLPIEAGCREGPVPADAEALARSIRSDPDLEATEPVAVGVGGIEALRMDVVAAAGASVCPDWEGPGVVRDPGVDDSNATVGLGGGDRMRLYLLDLPGGSARILAIAIVAPEARFKRVVEAAAPIMDSFEFRPR